MCIRDSPRSGRTTPGPWGLAVVPPAMAQCRHYVRQPVPTRRQPGTRFVAHTTLFRRVRYETSTRLSASRDGLVHIVRTLCHGRGHDGKPPRFGRGAPALSVTVLWR